MESVLPAVSAIPVLQSQRQQLLQQSFVLESCTEPCMGGNQQWEQEHQMTGRAQVFHWWPQLCLLLNLSY